MVEDAHGDRYLSGAYLAVNPDWHESDAAWKVKQIGRLLARNADLAVRRFCDVGCGTGLAAQLMLDLFPSAVGDGYEISPQAFARATERASDRLTFRNATPFDGPDRYDLAIALDVAEHVDDPFAFVRSLGRIARHVILHIPLDMNGLALLREWPILAAHDDLGHLHYFSRGTALNLVRDSGLQIVDEIYTPWAIDQSDKTLKKRVAALPRRIAVTLAPHAAVRILGGWSLLVLARSKP